MKELVVHNDAEEICRFLDYDLGEDSLEVLDHAYDLIVPIMNYIRKCKGMSSMGDLELISRSHGRVNSFRAIRAAI